MPTYAEYKEQIAKLQKDAEAARTGEVAEAKRKIEEIMKTYGLTLSDLGQRIKPVKQREPVAVKYRDPESGATWTGRGRAPLWLNGKNKDDFQV